MATKRQLISQLTYATMKKLTHTIDDWLNFLNCAAWHYKYTWHEQVMIYAQRPNAKACASMEVWNKIFKRWVNKGSKGTPLDFAKIEVAVFNLYGGWANLPDDSKELAEQISKSDNLEQLYESYRNAEKETKSELIAFEKDYPKVLTKDNMEDIITGLKKRKPKSDIER